MFSVSIGAALGLLVGLSFLVGGALFGDGAPAGFLNVAWLVAWVVVGFAVIPYLTVVAAAWLVRWVQELSTAEFVAAVLGLVIGLLMGSCWGSRWRPSRRRSAPGCRSPCRSRSASAWRA